MKDNKILICASSSYFTDDLHGVCECGTSINYRPHLAHIARKVCFDCGNRMMKRDGATHVEITSKVLSELTQHYRNARKN